MTPLQNSKSKFFFRLFWIFLLCLTLWSPVQAASTLSSAELQESASIILPKDTSLPQISGFSEFSMLRQANLSNGILAEYQARLSSDPWENDELPLLQILVMVYGSQDAAHYALNQSKIGLQGVVHQDEVSVLYQRDTGTNVDLFSTIDAEHTSYHKLHVNGNLLYQISLYRPDQGLSQKVDAEYAEAIQNSTQVTQIFDASLDSMQLALGILFPPTQTDLSTKSENSSQNLSQLYSIPKHGSARFQLYVSDPKGAVGTILDSAGISTPQKGDIYLYINNEGRLQAGLYAPDSDADCAQQAGWYRIQSQRSVHPYEWNEIALHYGVGGFYMELNGRVDGFCNVAQERSSRELFFGDYPGDGIAESMIGSVNDLSFAYGFTQTGRTWDSVLTDQLFLDLPNTDPDLPVFQFLKEKGIFMGSDGMLHPDEFLNRAEMTKTLLKTFGHLPKEEGSNPFWDVPYSAWYRKYLSTAYEIGMIQGNPDGSFQPASIINRAEFFSMLKRASGIKNLKYQGQFEDIQGGEWYLAGAAYAAEEKLVTTPLFEPDHLLTRREAARTLYQLLQ